MRQTSLTALFGGDSYFRRWVKDNLQALCDSSQIDVIQNVHASGAALSSLDNAQAGDIPIYTDATDVTFLTTTALFQALAALSSGPAVFAALAPPVLFSALPGSPTPGMIAQVTDSTTNTWGAPVTVGGGTNRVMVWWNSANWTVFAK